MIRGDTASAGELMTRTMNCGAAMHRGCYNIYISNNQQWQMIRGEASISWSGRVNRTHDGGRQGDEWGAAVGGTTLLPCCALDGVMSLTLW